MADKTPKKKKAPAKKALKTTSTGKGGQPPLTWALLGTCDPISTIDSQKSKNLDVRFVRGDGGTDALVLRIAGTCDELLGVHTMKVTLKRTGGKGKPPRLKLTLEGPIDRKK
jgi:hypothetical protein